MKMNALTGKRKSQVFISALIVLTIVLTLGVALLFHSRSLRDTTRLQVDTDRAYSLAKSGIGIAERYIDSHANDPTMNATTYNLGQGSITTEITFDQNTRIGNITSTGEMGRSVRILTKAFSLPRQSGAVIGGGWTKAYGNICGSQRFYFVRQTPHDEGFILAGYTTCMGTSSLDLMVIKTDASGNIDWSKAYGSYSNLSDIYFEEHRSVVQQVDDDGDGILDANDGYIVGGYTTQLGFDAGDFLVIKTDNNGNVQWARTYGSRNSAEYLYFLEPTDDNDDGIRNDGYILGGTTTAFGFFGSDPDLLIIKIDAAGNIQPNGWVRTYADDTWFDIFYCLYQTDDDNDGIRGDGFILGGRAGMTMITNMLIIKIDRNGNISPNGWAREYDTTSTGDRCYSIQQTDDGGYILGGFGYGVLFATGDDFIIVKLNNNGTVDWAKVFGTQCRNERAFSLQQTSNGEFIFGGRSGWYQGAMGMGGPFRFFAGKIDVQGNMQSGGWNRVYTDNSNNSELFSIRETNNGGFVMAGYTTVYGPGGESGFLVFTDSLGDIENCNIDNQLDDYSCDIFNYKICEQNFGVGVGNHPGIIHQPPIAPINTCPANNQLCIRNINVGCGLPNNLCVRDIKGSLVESTVCP